jgi:hypothetical protein
MGFATFMSSAAGRVIRVIAGLALIGIGLILALANNATVPGLILIIVGLVPSGAGLFDVCLFAPLFGAPLSGAKVRAKG